LVIEAALLGTGGMAPLPGRWLSSLLIRVAGQLVLFDCGEGTQIALRQTGWSGRHLAAICVSHVHADHIAGLPGLLYTAANAERVEPIDIYGPAGIAEVVRALRVIAPFLPYEVRVHELLGGERFSLPGGLQGQSVQGVHGLAVLAYRLDLPRRAEFLPDRAGSLGIPLHLWRSLQDGEPVTWSGGAATPEQVLGPPRAGLSLAYVTDTRPTPEIVQLAHGVDLLVCEGTYGSDDDLAKAMQWGHMTFREAATLAQDAHVKRLWITHFSPALEHPQDYAAVAREVFPETTVGVDGLTTRLTFRDA
jgi:ribonuclease Z